MKRYIYEILSGFTGTTSFQLPVFLEASVDEMGIMSGFDGEIEQVEQFANFTYAAGIGPSSTPGLSPTPTPTPTESPCPVNPSVTPSITPSNSISVTPSVTPTSSITPTPTPTASLCP